MVCGKPVSAMICIVPFSRRAGTSRIEGVGWRNRGSMHLLCEKILPVHNLSVQIRSAPRPEAVFRYPADVAWDSCRWKSIRTLCVVRPNQRPYRGPLPACPMQPQYTDLYLPVYEVCGGKRGRSGAQVGVPGSALPAGCGSSCSSVWKFYTRLK